MLVWRVVALIDFFCIDSDSADQDFAVKFKGEIISFIELLKSLRLLNASLPKNENVLLSAVFQLNGSSAHSCKDRCSWKKEALLSGVTVTRLVKRGVTVAWTFTCGKTQVKMLTLSS